MRSLGPVFAAFAFVLSGCQGGEAGNSAAPAAAEQAQVAARQLPLRFLAYDWRLNDVRSDTP